MLRDAAPAVLENSAEGHWDNEGDYISHFSGIGEYGFGSEDIGVWTAQIKDTQVGARTDVDLFLFRFSTRVDYWAQVQRLYLSDAWPGGNALDPPLSRAMESYEPRDADDFADFQNISMIDNHVWCATTAHTMQWYVPQNPNWLFQVDVKSIKMCKDSSDAYWLVGEELPTDPLTTNQ